MLTPDQLNSMTPEQRGEAFADLVAVIYGKRGVVEPLARDLRIHPKTYSAWKKKPGTIPNAVMLVFSFWADDLAGTSVRAQLDAARAAFADAGERLEQVSHAIGAK